MKIYKLDFDVDNFEKLEVCNPVDVEFYRMFDVTSLKSSLQIKSQG